MNILQTSLDGVLVVEPMVFDDDRGYFMELYHKSKYEDVGISGDFRQDNLSFSRKGALRGLHFQHPYGQAKLVQVLEGNVFDVVVDIRQGSPSLGKWFGVYLSGENKRQVFIPQGFAHGFCVVSDSALFLYKCSEFYAPECEGGVLWADPDLGIEWPIQEPIVSEKDAVYPRLRDIPADRLPRYEDGGKV